MPDHVKERLPLAASRSRSFSLTPRDVELVDWLSIRLGTSKSEAVRTAVRSMAASLASLSVDHRSKKRSKKPDLLDENVELPDPEAPVA